METFLLVVAALSFLTICYGLWVQHKNQYQPFEPPPPPDVEKGLRALERLANGE